MGMESRPEAFGRVEGGKEGRHLEGGSPGRLILARSGRPGLPPSNP